MNDLNEMEQRLARFQTEANVLLAACDRGKLTQAQKAQADRLITNLKALTREANRMAPAPRHRTLTDASPVAQAVARWSHQPLISIRGPFAFNRSGGSHARNRSRR